MDSPSYRKHGLSQRSPLVGFLAAVVFLAPFSTSQGERLVGTLQGDVVVDNLGQANYSIAVVLPPGSGGMTPEVSLSYSSGAGNGPLGLGWSMGGLSAVTRGPQMLDRDGRITKVDFEAVCVASGSVSNDRLYLDGQRLLRAPAGIQYWSEASPWIFRTEIEGHSRVEMKPYSGGGVWFEVKTKAGLVMQYGNSDDSRVVLNAKSVSWLLSEVRDTAGNFIRYKYTDALEHGDNVRLIDKIEYTGHRTGGVVDLEPYLFVRFGYEPRPDSSHGFMLGQTVSQKSRLKHIDLCLKTVGTPDAEVPFTLRHELSYQQSQTSGSSLLTEVQYFSRKEGTVFDLAPTTFSYDQAAEIDITKQITGPWDLGNWQRSGSHWEEKTPWDPIFAAVDIDGDGRAELAKLYWKHVSQVSPAPTVVCGGSTENATGHHLFLDLYSYDPSAKQFSLQTEAFPLTTYFPAGICTGITELSSLTNFTPSFMDLNHDGRTDLLVTATTAISGGGGTDKLRLYWLFVSDGSNLVLTRTWHRYGRSDGSYSSNDEHAETLFLADFSGNGIAEKMRACLHKIGNDNYLRLNVSATDPASLGNPEDWFGVSAGSYDLLIPGLTESNMAHAQFSVLDADGDGLLDVLVTYKHANGKWALLTAFLRYDASGSISFSTAGGSVVTSEDWNAMDLGFSVADMNGDGNVDLVLSKPSSYKVFLNRGNGFPEDAVHLAITPNYDSELEFCEEMQKGYIETVGWQFSRVKGSPDLFLDFDGDGRSDLVTLQDRYAICRDVTEQNFYEWQGGRFFAYKNHSSESAQSLGIPLTIQHGSSTAHSQDQGRHILLPWDTHGDGRLGFLSIYRKSVSGVHLAAWHLYSDTGPKHQLLTRATNGNGVSTHIVYGSLTERDESGSYLRYTANSDAPNPLPLQYPVIETPYPMPVVSAVALEVGEKLGIAGLEPVLYYTTYSYGLALAHLQGRGSLGFGMYDSLDFQTRLFSRQILEQAFPNTGMARSTSTYRILDDGGFVLLSHTLNHVLCDRVLDGAGQATGTLFPIVARAVEYVWEDREQADGASAPPPHYNSTVTTSWFDGDTTATPMLSLPSNWTDNGFAALPGNVRSGNITKVELLYPDGPSGADPFINGSKQTTINEYSDDLNAWILGRLTRSVVTSYLSTHPDNELPTQVTSRTATRVAYFDYYPGTGLLHAEYVEPYEGQSGWAPEHYLKTTHTRDQYGNVYRSEISGHPSIGSGSPLFVAPRTTSESVVSDLNENLGRFPGRVRNALNETQASFFLASDIFDWIIGKPTQLKGPNGTISSTAHDALGREVRLSSADANESYTQYGAVPPTAPVIVLAPAALPKPGAGAIDWEPLHAEAYSFVRRTNAAATAENAEQIVYFDRYGREIRGVSFTPDGRRVYKDTVYNLLGQVVAASENYFAGAAPSSVAWSRIWYDAQGRQAYLRAPDGTVTHIAYQGFATTTTHDYGGAAARQSISIRNWQGQNVKVINADGGEVRYHFDAAGNLVWTRPIPTSFSGSLASLEIVALFDNRGQKILQLDPDMGAWLYEYNALGQLVRQRDALSQSPSDATVLKYDLLGRLIERSCSAELSQWEYYTAPAEFVRPDNGWVGALKRESAVIDNITTRRGYYFDELGRSFLSLQSIELEPGKTQYYYAYTRFDGFSRPTAVDYYWRPRELNTNHSTLPYVWHSFGLRPRYNAYGATTGLRDSTGATWWMWADLDGELLESETFTANGQIRAFRNGLAETIRYDYDPNTHWVTQIRSQKAALGGDFHRQSYGYDVFGNLTARQVHGFQSTADTYGYDSAHRLKSRNGTNLVNYDGAGRITWKQNVGTYSYAGIAPHAVTSAGGRSMAYNANGSMTTRNLSGTQGSIDWTRFNQIRSVTLGNNSSQFAYDASHARVAHLRTEAGVVKNRTLYILGALEQQQKLVGGLWEVELTRISIAGPVGVVGVFVHDAQAAQVSDHQRQYFHLDHLGSVSAVTAGVLVQGAYLPLASQILSRYTYDEWGVRTERKHDWTLQPVSTEATQRGFTYHEMLDHLGLIHMNGRLYDPTLGRFLSADPHVQAPANLQNFDRYSYVLNNPLSYSDPSGYFFKKIAKFFKKHWRTITAIVLTVVVGAFAVWALHAWGMAAAGLSAATASFSSVLGAFVGLSTGVTISSLGAIIGGAIGGFVGGLVATGGSLKGALFGALSGAIAGAIGNHFGPLSPSVRRELQRAMAHGISGGMLASAQGGKFGAGFLANAFASGSGSFTPGWGRFEIVKAALVGGTGSSLGGGKFENGAVSGAFTYIFNQALHSEGQKGDSPDRRGFASIDEAGTAASIEARALTIACDDEFEYGGEIYRYEENGDFLFGYTEPRQGLGKITFTDLNGNVVTADQTPLFFKSVQEGEVVAYYHSHTGSRDFSPAYPGHGGDALVVETTRKPLYLGRRSQVPFSSKTVVRVMEINSKDEIKKRTIVSY